MKNIFFCTAIFLSILWMSGCDSISTPRDEPVLPVREIATAAPTHKNPVIARVNGKPIRKDALLDLLYQSHGQQMLDELMLLEMVRQYAREHGTKPQRDRVKNELQQLLDEMAPGKSAQDQKALLGYMLKSRGISRTQLNLILERQSLLREQVDQNVNVTEKMIKEEFQSRYGQRVTIRQLTVSNLRKIEQAKERLRAGEDFSKLVAQLSEDESTLPNGGLVGPFSQVDVTIPIEIRQGAFALQQIGQRSEVVTSVDEAGRQWWHLLQLEEVFPAEGTELSAVRESLHRTIRRHIIKQRMGELQQQIKAGTETFILDAQLRPVN